MAAQTFTYSGREYLRSGRSWAQIREVNLGTGRRVQLTKTPRDHWRPWCAPDGHSVLFTTGGGVLWRFDRATKKEAPLVRLERDLFNVVDAFDSKKIVVQEYGSIIELIDISKGIKVRRIQGVNPTVSPNRKLIAWQTPADGLARPREISHIFLSDADAGGKKDLGEGSAPTFLNDATTLLFVRFDRTNEQYDLVRYNLHTQVEDVRVTKSDGAFTDVSDLTVSPDGSDTLISGCCGRYGTALYWRLDPSEQWILVDENLGSPGGWSHDGQLIYATDGRDLRRLDSKRSVWGSDIKILNQKTGQISTVVSGTSMNTEPRWCTYKTNMQSP